MNIEKELTEKLREHFSDDASGHDLMHLVRVCNMAKHLQEKEGGNLEVIVYAALLHDVHRLIQRKTGKFCKPSDSIPEVKQLLSGFHLSVTLVEKIYHCVEFHEEYAFSKRGLTANDLETQILQDADNLDAMGAIGIARTFAYGGHHSLPIWLPEAPFRFDDYDESVNDISNIHHFYNKLLKLKDHMNTKTAKELGEARHQFMENFLVQFFDEWDGKK